MHIADLDAALRAEALLQPVALPFDLVRLFVFLVKGLAEVLDDCMQRMQQSVCGLSFVRSDVQQKRDAAVTCSSCQMCTGSFALQLNAAQ